MSLNGWAARLIAFMIYLQELSSTCKNLINILKFRSVNLSSLSKETSEKLLALADYLTINSFSQNPMKKSNS